MLSLDFKKISVPQTFFSRVYEWVRVCVCVCLSVCSGGLCVQRWIRQKPGTSGLIGEVDTEATTFPMKVLVPRWSGWNRRGGHTHGAEEAQQRGLLESRQCFFLREMRSEVGLEWRIRGFPSGQVGDERTAERGTCVKVMVWPPWSYVYNGFYPVVCVDIGNREDVGRE